MGDGNHSLATAKAIWEKIKPQVGMDHPARYALVEIENVHDEGLEFEPIHRVLFGLQTDILAAHAGALRRGLSLYARRRAQQEMVNAWMRRQAGPAARSAWSAAAKAFGVIEIANPTSNLPVGTLQAFLDAFLKEGGAEKIDYVHGAEVVCQLGSQPGNVGFYLPGMDKSRPVQDRHPGRRPAAQDLLDGRGPREALLHGMPQDRLILTPKKRMKRGVRPASSFFWIHHNPGQARPGTR